MELLRRYWWAFVVRGIFAIIFGLIVVSWPAASLAVIVIAFGIYALADGLVALFHAFSPSAPHRSALGFEAVIGIGIGILTLISPGITAIALYGWVAAWAILTGAAEMVEAIRLRKVIAHEVLLFFAGLASVVLGVLMIALPAAGLLAIAWVIGVYALIAGVLLIALGLRVRFGRPVPQVPAFQA